MNTNSNKILKSFFLFLLFAVSNHLAHNTVMPYGQAQNKDFTSFPSPEMTAKVT